MCVLSNVGDHYSDKWAESKWVQMPTTTTTYFPVRVEREEFEALKKEVAEMKELLKMAKILDEKLGQPDCEMEDKVATLKKVAELVGVSLDDVFKSD